MKFSRSKKIAVLSTLMIVFASPVDWPKKKKGRMSSNSKSELIRSESVDAWSDEKSYYFYSVNRP